MESWWNDPEFSDLSGEREGWWDDLELYEQSEIAAREAVSRQPVVQSHKVHLTRCSVIGATVGDTTNPCQSIFQASDSAAGPSTSGAPASSDLAPHRNFVTKQGYTPTDNSVVRGFPVQEVEAARRLLMLRTASVEQADQSGEVIHISRTSKTSRDLTQVSAPQKLIVLNRVAECSLPPSKTIVKHGLRDPAGP